MQPTFCKQQLFGDKLTKQEKFLQLFNPEKKKLEKFALSISTNRDDAKELVAETIFHAYKNFESLRDEKAFLCYLFTVATRAKAQINRKLKNIEFSSPEEFDFIFSGDIGPDDMTDITLLREAILKLKTNEKEALILKEFSGLSISEISKIQKTSETNVKVRIHRAKKNLEKLLK